MNRAFSARQKRSLYIRSEGKCERCGGPLGVVWHAHHARRHADGGVTEMTNARALCVPCHLFLHRGEQCDRT